MSSPLKLGRSYKVAFSPDSAALAVLAGGNVSVWNVASQELRFKVKLPYASRLDFSPKGERIAVKNTSGRITVLDTRTGDVLGTYGKKPDGEGGNLLFSPDGDQIVDCVRRGLLLRDATTGEERACFESSEEIVDAVHCTSDRSTWFVRRQPTPTSDTKPPDDTYFTMARWPLKEHFERLDLHFPFITVSAITGDGTLMALSFGAPPVQLAIVELASARTIKTLKFKEMGFAVAWSPDGQYLVLSVGAKFLVYETGQMKQVAEIAVKNACSAAISPNGEWLALGSWGSGQLMAFADVLESGAGKRARKRPQP